MLRRTRKRLRAIAASRASAHAIFFWQRENALVPRPAKNLKLEERIEVARRFTAGESAKELAAAFGLSPRHVNRLAKEEAGEGIAARDTSETVAFRASQSELAAFDAEWRERGVSNRSQARNAVLRGRGGFLDVPRDLVAEFCAAWRQAKDVSDAAGAMAADGYRVREQVAPDIVARALADGQLIGRCAGRSEFGARALGNRSILADPRDPQVVRRLNEKVKSSQAVESTLIRPASAPPPGSELRVSV